MQPISYLQTDPRWKDIDYSAPGEKTTIGASGCGPSCMAMIIATLKDPSVTPKETCAWALQKGYKAPNQGTYYSYFIPQGAAYGIEVKRVNTVGLRGMAADKAKPLHDLAWGAVNAGDFVIACMGPGRWTRSGHYILWYGNDGDQVLINDPNSTTPFKTKAPLSILRAEVKYYWIITNTRKEHEGMGTVFKDVEDDRWSVKYIEAAKNLGLISAGEDGMFYPAGSLTREQAAVIMVRLFEKVTGRKVV